jgi:hypothetical protein
MQATKSMLTAGNLFGRMMSGRTGGNVDNSITATVPAYGRTLQQAEDDVAYLRAAVASIKASSNKSVGNSSIIANMVQVGTSQAENLLTEYKKRLASTASTASTTSTTTSTPDLIYGIRSELEQMITTRSQAPDDYQPVLSSVESVFAPICNALASQAQAARQSRLSIEQVASTVGARLELASENSRTYEHVAHLSDEQSEAFNDGLEQLIKHVGSRRLPMEQMLALVQHHLHSVDRSFTPSAQLPLPPIAIPKSPLVAANKTR